MIPISEPHAEFVARLLAEIADADLHAIGLDPETANDLSDYLCEYVDPSAEATA